MIGTLLTQVFALSKGMRYPFFMKSAFAYEFEELCVNALRSSGGRVTDARRAVIHCLATATSAVSAKHVISKIEKSSKLPDIDQVSVYRILDTLVELGLVHRVFPSGDFIPCRHSHCKNIVLCAIRLRSSTFQRKLHRRYVGI